MLRRRKTKGQTEGTELETLLGEDEDDETFFQYRTNFYEASSSKFTHSANPDEECRFILLGGDEGANKDVCRIIFRNQPNQQRTELKDWELQENHVHGRRVTVAISPPTWLKHLRSYIFQFFGIRSIKNDLEKCLSVAFPGPNAFLLVIRDGCDNGEEHFLLKAVASVFGKKTLDYSMVVFIKGSGQKHSNLHLMKCVKRCPQYHVLDDTDSSVQELFGKVLRMVGDKKMKFCIPPEYEEFMETEFESWEKRRISNMNELLAKWQDEKDNLIGELRNDRDASKKSESELQKELDVTKKRERELQKKLDVTKKNLDASKVREDQLRMELDAYEQRENQLRKLMKDYESGSSQLSKILDASTSSNYELRRNCEALHIRARELQKDLDVSKKNERELQKKLEATHLRETNLIKELDDFRRNECNPGRLLDSAQQRESKVNKEDCGEKKDNTVQEPQASGTRNRRGSKDLDVPNFSTDETHYYLDTM